MHLHLLLYSSTIKSRHFFASVFVGDRVSGSDEMLYDLNTITQTSLKCYVDNQHLIFLSRLFQLHIVTFFLKSHIKSMINVVTYTSNR